MIRTTNADLDTTTLIRYDASCHSILAIRIASASESHGHQHLHQHRHCIGVQAIAILSRAADANVTTCPQVLPRPRPPLLLVCPTDLPPLSRLSPLKITASSAAAAASSVEQVAPTTANLSIPWRRWPRRPRRPTKRRRADNDALYFESAPTSLLPYAYP